MPETSRTGIGRGLSALLPTAPAGEVGLREIPLELVRSNPDQPRRSFDEARLSELAESIASRGLLQPIVVRPLAGGHYELIAGERRLRAARLAGLETVPALSRATEDSERLELALAENMARQDLNAIEEARACSLLVEDVGLTKEEVGRRVGRSRAAISNLVRLLALPEEALELIERDELSEGHGRALLLCKDHAARRSLARAARDRGWSVRETERRAREADTGSSGRKRSQVVLHPDLEDALARAEDALAAALGRDAKARMKGDRLTVELEFESPAEAIELAQAMLAGRARNAA